MSATEPKTNETMTPETPAKPSAWARAKDFFTATQTPRWHSYATAVFAVVVSVGISNFSDNKKRNDDYRVQQIRSLTDSMTQFQVYSSAFAYQMSEAKTGASDAKRTLIQNLNDQYARLGLVEKIIPETDRQIVESYKMAVLNMERVVNSTEDMMGMGPYWTAASKLLVARNRLNDALRRSI